MKRLFGTAALLSALTFFAGCVPPGTEPEPTPPSPIQQVDDLFVAVPVEEGGGYRLTTNDSAFWGPYGYTLWALKGAEQTPFTTRKAALCKTSGDDSAGFGIVICHYEDADPGIGETMLVVMINTKQQYIVGEVIGAEFTQIVPWTYSDRLLANKGQTNVVRVDYDDVLEEYILWLNGTEVKSFRDDEAPFHSAGGDNGYIVVISPLDEFPAVPVQVSFKDQ
jgi:hypothetical protein